MESAEPVGEVSFRLAITGASGWLGRELIARILSSSPETAVLALGQSDRRINIDGHSVMVRNWADYDVRDWSPDQVFHLAYRTREHYLSALPESVNTELTARFLKTLSVPSVSSAVYISSGAAVSAKFRGDAYGQQKYTDEQACIRAAAEANVAMVVGRVWSVSGRHCQRPNLFLFHDLIGQALDVGSDSITVSSRAQVYRRYVDAGDFLFACFRLAQIQWTGIVDSGGALVSAVELATRIRKMLAPRKRLLVCDELANMDLYAAETDSTAWLEETAGLAFRRLDDQIIHSSSLRLGAS